MSFEGPDIYSRAGGLGVRMAELSKSLAEAGHETHLFFVGDPDLPEIETRLAGKLILHRWCQSTSRRYPLGVYDGEAAKLSDFQSTVPNWIIKNIFSSTRKRIIVMSEEWQMAQTVISLSRQTKRSIHSPEVIFLWNANNVFGFDRIDWPWLKHYATLTTVSRYMKQLMRSVDANPLVIPNGIPERWFKPIASALKKDLREAAGGDYLLAKVGRFDPGKQWLMAIESLAQLRQSGLSVKLMMRGDRETHGREVRDLAQTRGLKLKTLELDKNVKRESFFKALRQSSEADIFDLQFFVSEEILRLIYFSADAVLANSIHEPFGLVGLEVMACGGVAITGSTGEDYAQSFQNAVVADTSDPWELTANLQVLFSNPRQAETMRKQGHLSAKAFLWPKVIAELKRKLAYIQLKPMGS